MALQWPALSRTSLSAACPPAGVPLISAARHCTVRRWASSSDSTAPLVPLRQPACRAEAASGAAVVRLSCNLRLQYDSLLHASTNLLHASPLPTLTAPGARRAWSPCTARRRQTRAQQQWASRSTLTAAARPFACGRRMRARQLWRCRAARKCRCSATATAGRRALGPVTLLPSPSLACPSTSGISCLASYIACQQRC